MYEKETTDALAKVLNKIESWCSAKNIKLIFGHLEDESGLPVVQYEGQGNNPNDDFLQLIDRLSPPAVVVSVVHLSEERWQDEIDKVTSSLETPEDRARLRIVQDCRERIGQIAMLIIQAFIEHPTLILSHHAFSSWSHNFVPSEEEENAGFDQEQIEDPKTRKRIETLARRLAEHSRFPSAKSREAQAYLAESVLADENLEGIELWDLARRAKVIFDMDIKPKLEASLREKARKLRAEGHSVKDVADELDLSVGYVQRLLA